MGSREVRCNDKDSGKCVICFTYCFSLHSTFCFFDMPACPLFLFPLFLTLRALSQSVDVSRASPLQSTNHLCSFCSALKHPFQHTYNNMHTLLLLPVSVVAAFSTSSILCSTAQPARQLQHIASLRPLATARSAIRQRTCHLRTHTRCVCHYSHRRTHSGQPNTRTCYQHCELIAKGRHTEAKRHTEC